VINCLPIGKSSSRRVAINAPADAPTIFCSSKCDANFLKQVPTPTGSKCKFLKLFFGVLWF